MKPYLDIFAKTFLILVGLGHLVMDLLNYWEPAFAISKLELYGYTLLASIIVVIGKFIKERNKPGQPKAA